MFPIGAIEKAGSDPAEHAVNAPEPNRSKESKINKRERRNLGMVSPFYDFSHYRQDALEPIALSNWFENRQFCLLAT